MSWLLTLVAAFLLLIGYWRRWKWRHRRLLELAAKVPGPPAWPVVGNSLLFLNPAGQADTISFPFGQAETISFHLYEARPKRTHHDQIDGILKKGQFKPKWTIKTLPRCKRCAGEPCVHNRCFEQSPVHHCFEEQLNKISELTQQYGDYLKIWLGPELNIFVKSPADIRLLLTSSKVNQKGPVYDLMKTYIGPGILTGGSTWRNHRKIATPSYKKKCVQEYVATFNRESEQLAEVLCSKDLGVTIDVYQDVVKTTTQCVCQTLMGLSKKDSQNLNRLDEVIFITQRMYGHIFNKMTKWWLQIPFVFWLVGGKKTEDYYLKAIDDLSSDIVSRKRKDLETIGVGKEESLGVVDRYILSGELSEQEIKWETFSLFTTSQEASAKIASGVLMFLAHLPDWQVGDIQLEKVLNEIVHVLGPHDGPVSMDQLKELHHLDMVYKETLRYFSIAALIQRTVEDEITINDGKITLPAGTSLVIPIHDVHRDPRYWTEPYRVMPERFLPENVAARDPNAFVPFSLGAMDCLGRVYATALIKTLVVRVLRKVQLEGCGPIDNLPLEVAISVKPTNGYKLRLKPRRVINARIHA